ncbi:MAG: site-2 protease family protein, partial [Clostridia bacterium]|nr:site-2 protease family protein [Clostridia bacterium]
MSGPVGVTTTIGDAAKQGIGSLMYLAAVLAMNLGVFNLLPIPALDGGRLFFQLIELVRGRPIPPKYEGMIHFAGIVLLMGLMLAVTYKDIIKLITG